MLQLMMAPHQLPLLISLLLLSVHAASANAEASVPAVLLASPSEQLDKLAATAPKVASGTLADGLHSAASRYLLVVTVDEGLSLADFARYGYGDAVWGDSPFANVAALSAKLGSRHLLVSQAGKLVDSLRSLEWPGGPAVEVGDDAEASLQRAVVEGAGARLLIARAADLAGADRILGRACALMQSRGLPFIAVFTAAKPSSVASESAVSASVNRHLLAAADATPNPNQNGTFVSCQSAVLLYYTSLGVRFVEAGVQKFFVTIPPVADGSTLVNPTQSRCNATGSNQTLALKYPPPGVTLPPPLSGLELTIQVVADSFGFWSITSATIAIKCADGIGTNCTNFNSASVSAKNLDSLQGMSSPYRTCYHCSAGATLKVEGNASLSLEFVKFQFQPFGVKNGQFSASVNDCIGFFSVEVWFSLLVIVVVTTILMYGVLMLLSVATPDRFDDPKGKTIQVNVQEGN